MPYKCFRFHYLLTVAALTGMLINHPFFLVLSLGHNTNDHLYEQMPAFEFSVNSDTFCDLRSLLS